MLLNPSKPCTNKTSRIQAEIKEPWHGLCNYGDICDCLHDYMSVYSGGRAWVSVLLLFFFSLQITLNLHTCLVILYIVTDFTHTHKKWETLWEFQSLHLIGWILRRLCLFRLIWGLKLMKNNQNKHLYTLISTWIHMDNFLTFEKHLIMKRLEIWLNSK